MWLTRWTENESARQKQNSRSQYSLFIRNYFTNSHREGRLSLGSSPLTPLFTFQAIIRDPFMLNSVILVFANKQDMVSSTRRRPSKPALLAWIRARHPLLSSSHIFQEPLCSLNPSKTQFFFIKKKLIQRLTHLIVGSPERSHDPNGGVRRPGPLWSQGKKMAHPRDLRHLRRRALWGLGLAG